MLEIIVGAVIMLIGIFFGSVIANLSSSRGDDKDV